MKKQLLIDYGTVDESLQGIQKLLNKCKHEYYKENIEESKGDIRKIYTLISDAVNEKREKITIFK